MGTVTSKFNQAITAGGIGSTTHWCPTKETVADFWTKPLQGSHFRKLSNYIMGRVRCVKPKADAISIGKAAKKKVAEKSNVSRLRRSTVGGIKGCTRILSQ